jgi:hypothetical protein
MAILQTGRHTEFNVRPNDRSKDKALAGSLLQARFGFLDGWISLDRGLHHVFESDCSSRMREQRDEN